MTTTVPGPSDRCVLSIMDQDHSLYRTRREVFLFSMLGQALVIALFVYIPICAIRDNPGIVRSISRLKDLPLVFAGGVGGGGGGGLDKLPASRGAPPKASLHDQLTPPTVILPKEPPKLAVDTSVMVAPDVKLPESGQYGDPMARISNFLSNGPGGPGGTGEGCCNGVGPSHGPGVGPGPGGIHQAGVGGVTYPHPIFDPEPSFSDEARKSKTQGSVTLLLVVGADGRTYDIRVRNSLGMGLDEKAIEAVRAWRFRPATLNGKPVDAQIAVEVDFHLY